MNLHEYQAKKILKGYGIPIPEFGVASNGEEARRIVEELHLNEAVVKIQVHAGGRGKAGGVKFAKGKEEIVQVASSLIGMKMVNQQTGPDGVVAKQVMISKPVEIAKEFYLGAVIDRDRAVPVLIASPEGGMEIEELAAKSPEMILKMPFAIDGKLRPFQLLRLTKFMGWKGDLAKKGAQIASAIAKCFIEKDGSLLEINPLVQTKQNEIVALDAKLSVDDSALFRQSEIVAFSDEKGSDLAYVAMHGDIGCMVNGAGLAMATMDIIHLYGGAPANFLDVGGGASKEKVAEGFQIILADPKVKAVLVNIFGGIMNCATVAEGVIHAAKELQIKIPIIVRLEGTNVEEGKRLFRTSHLKIMTAKDLKQAAELAVKHGHTGK